MSIGTPVAADVPGLFDVIINGQGYMFLRTIDTSLPFRVQRALYGRTATFLERQNVSGAYSDNQQDFFLTASQKDWSGGSGQHFFHSDDADSAREFYRSTAVHVDVPGAIQLRPAVTAMGSVAVAASCPRGAAVSDGHAYGPADVHLWTVNAAGTATDQGAHGAGSVPHRWGMCTDGVNIFTAGTSQIRKWNGSAFSNFGTNAAAGALAFLNNSLYSCDGSVLKVYDTAGLATTLFTWKDAAGAALTPFAQKPKIIPFGGQLLIYFPYLVDRPELWLYDGSTTRRIAALSNSMVGYDIYVMDGIVYVSGLLYDIPDDANVPTGLVEVVMYYANGTIGELWRSPVGGDTAADFASTSYPTLGSVNGNLVFTDPNNGQLFSYNPRSGAIVALADIPSPLSAGAKAFAGQMSSSATSVLVTWNSTSVAGSFYPSTSYATTGSLTSSLIDFENSLTKQFRGIKVDFTGSGTVDIAYAVDAVTGHTNLQTSAVSGTEYTLPTNTSGRGLSYKVTLNKSGANVPVVKRVYLRASPILQSFRTGEYILDLSGRDGGSPVILNDNQTAHPLDGLAQATNLNTAISSTSPFTITDRFGGFTGVIEPGKTEIIEVAPEEYIARIVTREI